MPERQGGAGGGRWARRGAGGSLKDAQLAKLDQVLALAGVEAHHDVLEIGCGWGSMAIRAVQTTGCRCARTNPPFPTPPPLSLPPALGAHAA